MQVDRARALRSKDTVENCSLSRRVARVAMNSKSGDERWGSALRGYQPWDHCRFLFISASRI